MLISFSLRDKPAAQQSGNSVTEQCPIILVRGASGRVPGQMAL